MTSDTSQFLQVDYKDGYRRWRYAGNPRGLSN
jgi:hypothetical protein